MSNKEAIKIGAVVYSPTVITIWEIIKEFFDENNSPIEMVYYNTYEEQVDGMMAKEIDIAWNSPLAHVDTKIRTNNTCVGVSMRDTDRERKAHFIVRREDGFKKLQDLKGKIIGFGAVDSPQARLIPIVYLHNEGLKYGQDYVERTFDLDVGLHGDHIGGEIEALKALQNKEVDVAIVADSNWAVWQQDGTADPTKLMCLDTTTPYDHCIFTVRPGFPTETLNEWANTLYKMDYNVPEHKKMMDLEGLKVWLPGRESGFAQVEQAVALLNFFKK